MNKKTVIPELISAAFFFVPTVIVLAIILRAFVQIDSLSVSGIQGELMGLCEGETTVSLTDINYDSNAGIFQVKIPDDVELEYDYNIIGVYDAWNRNDYNGLFATIKKDYSVEKLTRRGNNVINECDDKSCVCIGNSLSTFMSLKDMHSRACFTRMYNLGREFFDKCLLSYEYYCRVEKNSYCSGNANNNIRRVFRRFDLWNSKTSVDAPEQYSLFENDLRTFDKSDCDGRLDCQDSSGFSMSELISFCTEKTMDYVEVNYNPTKPYLVDEKDKVVDCYDKFGPGSDYVFTYTGNKGGYFLGLTNTERTLDQEDTTIILEKLEEFAELTGYGFVLEFNNCFKLPSEDDCYCPNPEGREMKIYAPQVGKVVMIGISGSKSVESKINIDGMSSTLTDVGNTCDFVLSPMRTG